MTTDHFPPSGGGVEVVIAEVASRLAKEGHDILVVTLANHGDVGPERFNDVRVKTFTGYRLNRVIGLEVRFSVGALLGMKRVLASFSPQVVNAHHSLFTTTPAAIRAARELEIPSVLTLHVGSLSDLRGVKGLAARSYESLVSRRLIDRADEIIAVSRAVADTVSVPNVTVVHNGVDTHRFHPARTGNEGQRVLFVGRMIANKGPDVMLRAFSQVSREFPESRLTMVGDGPLLGRMERQAERLGLGHRVRFLGMRTDTAELMRASDIFVRPSLLEGMPLTVLEAMASGLAVVASNTAGVAEAIVDRESGLLVEPGSASDVAAALRRLMQDVELREAMAAQARKRAVAHFSWERTARETEKALLKAARGRRR